MKKLLFGLLLLILPMFVVSAAEPQITSVVNENDKVTVTGTIDYRDEIVQVAIFDADGTLVSLGTTELKNKAYSYTSDTLSLKNKATYTVKTALYNGECTATKTFKASVTPKKNIPNPQTWDSIYTYIIIAIVAIVCIGVACYYIIKGKKNKGENTPVEENKEDETKLGE